MSILIITILIGVTLLFLSVGIYMKVYQKHSIGTKFIGLSIVCFILSVFYLKSNMQTITEIKSLFKNESAIENIEGELSKKEFIETIQGLTSFSPDSRKLMYLEWNQVKLKSSDQSVKYSKYENGILVKLANSNYGFYKNQNHTEP